jgi:hypothetical protein
MAGYERESWVKYCNAHRKFVALQTISTALNLASVVRCAKIVENASLVEGDFSRRVAM